MILTGRKLLTQLKLIVPALLMLVLFAGVADAQNKTTKKSTAKKSTTKTVVPPLEVRTAREKAVIQRDNVNFWIDKLGPIAEALELLDNAYAKKKPSQTTLATHEDRKKKFVATLRNLRDDLALLESDFRTKPALQKYRINLEGVSDLAAGAEDMAIAGKFVASKQPLRDAAKKLTDTLATMPR